MASARSGLVVLPGYRPVTPHVEVTTTLGEWVTRTPGLDPRGGLDAAAWLGLPQQRLLHVTAGGVFRDDDGELTRMRRQLSWYPDDVWAWMVLSGWPLIGNTEPMRGWCIETGDAFGERLLTARLCRLIMELAFLQERRYWPYDKWPYDKWFGAAFGRLGPAVELSPLLGRALTSPAPDATAALRDAVTLLGHRHNSLGVGRQVKPRYGPRCRHQRRDPSL